MFSSEVDVRVTREQLESWLSKGSDLSERSSVLKRNCEANAGLMYEALREALDLVPRMSDDDPIAPALADWVHQVRAIVRMCERED